MKIPLNKNYSAIWENFFTHDNREALSSIYFDHYDLLFNFGLKHTNDRQIVEDSIQNTFSYFLKSRKKLGKVHNVPGYLFISFRRQLFLDLKKQKKSLFAESLSENHFDYFSNPESDMDDREDEIQLRNVIKKCLQKLSAKQQEIIYLRFECDLSYEDISDMLEITVESCHKSIYRSIKAIRTEAQKIQKVEERLILFFLGKGKTTPLITG
jgi:RNA polymerase sigma factor (sigma-70 family)